MIYMPVMTSMCLFRGNAYARRHREREMEMDEDEKDRQKEKDELETLKIQVLERQHKQLLDEEEERVSKHQCSAKICLVKHKRVAPFRSDERRDLPANLARRRMQTCLCLQKMTWMRTYLLPRPHTQGALCTHSR